MPDSLSITKLVEAVNGVLGDAPRPVPLHTPTLDGNAWPYVKQCIDTGWVSTAGAFVERFEKELADYTGTGHAVAVSNGTAALHAALLLAGVQPDDEVLLPSLTFVATANAVAYCHAVPHFVEVEAGTLGIDPVRLHEHLHAIAERRDAGCFNRTTGRRMAALIGMHAFGHPFNLDGAARVCEEYGLTLVEDAAESLGSFYRGRHTGTFGRMGILSFNGNKTITTGGGGAVLTNDDTLACEAKHLTTTAKRPHRWEYIHDRVGFNYRMPNLNAALGCAQLELLPKFLQQKRELAHRYAEAFSTIEGADVLAEPPNTQCNFWLNTLVLEPAHALARDALLEAMHEAGLLVRPIWKPMHQLSMYTECPRMDLTITESLVQRTINLPSSAGL